jgi:hypothetical protein
MASKAGRAAGDQVLDELATRLTKATEGAVEHVIRLRGPSIAADADAFRLEHPTLSGAALDRAIIRDRARKLGSAGFVTGLPSVVPIVGTTVEVAAAAADAVAVLYGQVATVLALCHLHGRDIGEREERRLDVLLVLGIDAGLVQRNGDVLHAAGQEIDLRRLRTTGLPPDLVARLNRNLGDRIIQRIANRRARSLLGRLLPFGLGVAVAASTDYKAGTSVGRAALTYLDWLQTGPVTGASGTK